MGAGEARGAVVGELGWGWLGRRALQGCGGRLCGQLPVPVWSLIFLCSRMPRIQQRWHMAM